MRAYAEASARSLVAKWRVRARTAADPLEDKGMAWYQIFHGGSIFGTQPANTTSNISFVESHIRIKPSSAADCLFKIAQSHRNLHLPSLPQAWHEPPG